MRIYSPEITGSLIVSGSIIPGKTDQYNLGSPTSRFKDLYLSGSTIYLGDIQLKESDGKFAVVDNLGTSISISGSLTGSLQGTATSASYVDFSNIDNKPTLISSSAQITSLPSINTDNLSEGSTNLYYTDSKVKTKLNIEGVISSSAQIASDISGSFGQVSSSFSSKISDLLLFSSSLNTTRNTYSGSFSGSFVGDGSQLSGVTSYTDQDTLNYINSINVVSGSSQIIHDNTTGFVSNEHIDHSQVTLTAGNGLTGGGDITTGRSFAVGQGDGISVGSDNVAVDSTVVRTSGIQTIAGNKTFSNNITIQGDLQVTGTTTTVNSTTVSIADNIIEINGTGAANGGILVKDITSPGTVSGSLLWDGTNNYWKLGTLGSENRVLTIADEGSGNGLDADTLDGQEGSYYRNASNINAGTINDAYLPGTISSDITGNAATATKWATARTITLGGDLTGNVSIDGSANVTLTAAVVDDSHTHDGRYFTETEADARFLGISAKAADSDKLDNLDSSQFFRSDAGDSAVGFFSTTNVNASGDPGLSINDGGRLGFNQSGTRSWTVKATGGNLAFFSGDGSGNLTFNSNTIWTAGNDGALSGLDADLLDGQHGSYYLNASNINAGTIGDAYLPATISSDITGNASTATKWATARTITLGGDLTGNVSIDGSANVTLTAAVADDSHNHIISNIDGLQTALDGKAASSHTHTLGYYNSSLQNNLDTLYSTGQFGWYNSTTGRPENYGQGINIVSSGTAHNGSDNWITQLGFGTNGNTAYFRTKVNTGGWSSWHILLHSSNYNSYSPTLTGTGASGTWGISITGNAATATNLSTTRSDWSTNGTISAVVGQLSWKNYGNNHTIFDASNSTSPQGSSVNNTNAAVAWTPTYPTLMGWNGSTTYGVRVDSARVADNAGTLDGIDSSQFLRSDTSDTMSGNLTVTGTVSATTITETSAREKKENIESLDNALDSVMKLNPVTFNFKENDRKEIGFIADEVNEVYPEFVSDNIDAVSYSKMVSVLTKAIQELNERLMRLENGNS